MSEAHTRLTPLSRRSLRVSLALTLLVLPLVFAVASVAVTTQAEPRPVPRGAPRALAQTGLGPAPPVAQITSGSLETQLTELRALVRAEEHPDALLGLLRQLRSSAVDPDSRQLTALALTALSRYEDDPQVASFLTDHARNAGGDRCERLLALDGLRYQRGCLDRDQVSALLEDTDPMIRQRAQALVNW